MVFRTQTEKERWKHTEKEHEIQIEFFRNF